MQKFYIKHSESQTIIVAVEAHSEEEALERFEEWRLNSEQVLDTISSSDNIECDSKIISNAWFGERDILTDAAYQKL